MISGGRLGGLAGTGTKDPPLIQLVEQYLADNSNLSYINIDDMIDYFQAQYFRFARMQRKVFANQVRSAYFDYCRRNTNNNKVTDTNAPQVPARPSVTVRNVTELAGDSDSDVEEIGDDEEVLVPVKDIVNSSLASMCKINAAATSASKTPKKVPIISESQNMEPCSTSNAPEMREEVLNSVTAAAPFPSNPDSDSDDDLEIIDEVQGRIVIQKMDQHGEGTRAGHVQSVSSTIPSGITVTVVGQDSDAGGGSRIALAPKLNQLLKEGRLNVPIVVDKSNKHSAYKAVGPIPTVNGVSSSSSKSGGHRNGVGVPFNSNDQQRGTKRKNIPSDRDTSDELTTSKKLKREVTIVSDTGYRLADFAGSQKVVEEVCRLLMHLKHPEVYKKIGVTAPRGFLLHGPPGVGKTLLANAIAGELQLPMLKVTGTEFVSGISGESESNIRDLFNQAIVISPCIIFIDEIDSITPKRETVQREMERRIVAQLLSCVDDLMNHEKGSQVLLIGATNRIEAIDTALRRAGRFDKEICLGIPDEKSRHKILEVICRNLRLAPGFDLSLLAKLTPGYVGADLQMLVREAAVQAVNKVLMCATNFEKKYQHPELKEVETAKDKEETAVSSLLDDPKIMVSVAGLPDETPTDDSVNCEATVEEQLTNEADEQQVPPVDSVQEEAQLPVSVEVPDSSDSGIESKADGIAEQTEINETEQEEKMEVDADAVDGSIPHIISVKMVQEEPPTIDCEMNDLKYKEGKPDEPAPYLRWIRDAAPLTAAQLDELYLFIDDFEEALKHVQPSSKREGFATVPDTTWDDIGALADIREELEVSILGPVKYSRAYENLGLMSPAGVLLCGPPGCGKTLLAKAVAHEAGINFISVKGPELLNMYVGESERAVRQCFQRAKNSSPCVIFFDEIDALCPRRSDAPESGSGSRIVNQLLTEMDGVEGRQGVFVMAATNRPDILDPAILRPGRLDKVLFVDMPSATDRYDILRAITKSGTKPVLSSDVDLKVVANRECCDNYTGADLASLVREASIAAFKDLVMDKSQDLSDELKVTMRHFEVALLKTKPSVTKEDRDKYAEMKKRYSCIGGR